MELEINIDRNRCMGSGQCVHWAPGVFTQDDEAISVVVDPRGEPEERIVNAVTGCPVEAISLSIERVKVEAPELRDWTTGARSDHPLVAILEQLGRHHEELRTSLEALDFIGSSETAASPREDRGEDEVSLQDLADSLADHRALEQESAYPVIASLVKPSLVHPFEQSHSRIDQLVRRLSGGSPEPDSRSSIARLVRLLDDHIRLEETILFPVALGRLAADV
jgi:ferredoxin